MGRPAVCCDVVMKDRIGWEDIPIFHNYWIDLADMGLPLPRDWRANQAGVMKARVGRLFWRWIQGFVFQPRI